MRVVSLRVIGFNECSLLDMLQGGIHFGIKFCSKINDIGKFVLLILIIEMRFFGTLLSCFSLVFFSLNKFNYFCTKTLLNGTMNTIQCERYL